MVTGHDQTCTRVGRSRRCEWVIARRPPSDLGRYAAMTILERHTSPDNLLHLVVDFTDGDWTIGFEGCAWHTHGDLLYCWGCEARLSRQFESLSPKSSRRNGRSASSAEIGRLPTFQCRAFMKIVHSSQRSHDTLSRMKRSKCGHGTGNWSLIEP